MSAQTVLPMRKYDSWGWVDPAKLMQAVDESHTLQVRLAMGTAQINRIVLTSGGRTYNVYPEGELPIAYAGEEVQIVLFIANIGDDATLFVQLTSPEISATDFWHVIDGYTNYHEKFMVATEIDFQEFIWTFIMPNTNVNLTVEAGHV
jgi:hypothetical protein